MGASATTTLYIDQDYSMAVDYDCELVRTAT